MKALALILVIFVATSNATSLFDRYPMNFSSRRSIMSVLTQVESQMKNHGPMDAITKLLNDFVVEVTNEQVQHDNLWAEQQVQCADEVGFRNAEIAAAAAAIQEATETLDSCNSQKIRASQDLVVTKKQLSENRNLLAQVEETRRREAYAFESATEVYNICTRASTEALITLEEIWSGEASFIQLTRHVNGMLKNAVKIRKAHFLGGIMAALAQMAAKDIQGDEALLEQVKNMLINFRDKVEAEFQTTVAAENAAISAYNEDKARLEATIEHLSTQRDQLKEELSQLEICITVQTGIKMTAEKKQSRNQKLLDDGDSLCAAVEQEYVTSTAQRKEELELLEEIKKRVEIRFAQVSDYVTQRGEQDEFETEGWQNQNSGAEVGTQPTGW